MEDELLHQRNFQVRKVIILTVEGTKYSVMINPFVNIGD